MEIKRISDSISIYSDGKRLQVIHDLGDEFILDINLTEEQAYNVDDLSQFSIIRLEPVFKICGFCSKAGAVLPLNINGRDFTITVEKEATD